VRRRDRRVEAVPVGEAAAIVAAAVATERL